MSGKGGSELGDRTEEKIERRDDEEQVVEEKHATKGREKKETADGEEKKDVTEEKGEGSLVPKPSVSIEKFMQ